VPPSTDQSHREFWQNAAERIRLRINAGWCLETLAAPLVILSLAGAVILLGVRRELPHTQPWMLLAGVVGALWIACGIAFLRAMRKFETKEESLVRIEAAMRMRNSLSAAKAGITPWPAPVSRVDVGLNWNWPRLLVPLLGACALLGAGLWIPVSSDTPGPGSAADQPQAWKQLGNELDLMAKEQLADEKYLEETRKRLEELEAQEEDQWFSHSSLEATDSLKKSHNAEAKRVENELGKAGNALGQLEKNAGGQAEKDRLMEEFDQALQGLRNGAMKPNPQLLEQLKNLDLNNLGDLPPDQLQQLKENLRKNAHGLGKCQGGDGENWDDELLADENQGEGNGQPGKDGDGPGKGGVNRGPGHAPGVLGKDGGKLDTGKMEALKAQDLSHAAPGDLLELQDGEHQVDKSGSGISEGGNTEATGSGGDRVWKESLDPDEQRVLKKYFE
jgi:hypothetical protein